MNMWRAIWLWLPAVVLAARAQAQDPRLEARLDPPTLVAVGRVLDSARVQGLPTEPLIQKALEGASKRAPGPRIVGAVETMAAELGTARSVLGPGTSADELIAGAGALHAGIGAPDLGRLRGARAHAQLATPLAIVADLIARGVPADTAMNVVVGLAQSGARDADFVELGRNVSRDISAGAPPAAAASVRGHGRPKGVPEHPDRGKGKGSGKPPKKK